MGEVWLAHQTDPVKRRLGVTSGNATASVTVTAPTINATGTPTWSATRDVTTGDKTVCSFTPPA